MSHLNYQNILWPPEAVEGIDIKDTNPEKICSE